MTKSILSGAAVLAAVLLTTATAAAAPAPTVEGDIPIAEVFWGGPPAQCSSLSVALNPIPGAAGDATQPSPGTVVPCEMQLSEVGTQFEGVEVTPELACLITVHEEGHLHGLGHSADPDSIMYPAIEFGTARERGVPACAERLKIVGGNGAPGLHRRRFRRAEPIG